MGFFRTKYFMMENTENGLKGYATALSSYFNRKLIFNQSYNIVLNFSNGVKL